MEKVYLLDKETNTTYYLVGVKFINPSKSATITEYSVPEGSFLSDHSYKNADTLNLSLIADGFDAIKQSYYVNFDGTSDSLSYEMLKGLLNRWISEAVRVDVQTAHGLFKNMVLTNYSWPETKDSWSKFNPTLTFKEVKIAQITTTQLNALNVRYGADYAKEETSAGEDNGSSTTSQGIIGKVLAGAATGAVAGGIVGHPVIGGLIGGVVGFFKAIFS